MTKNPKISKSISKYLFLKPLKKEKPLTPYSKKFGYLNTLEYKLKYIRNKKNIKDFKS